MPGEEKRSYLDLHPHTSYSKEISGELTPYGGILIQANPPLSPVEVAVTSARRLSFIAQQEGGGNVFLPVGDLLSPRGAWELLDELGARREPDELIPFVPRIIPAFEQPVFYHDPFLKRKRTVHLYILGVTRGIFAQIMTCDGKLQDVVRICDENEIFFFLAHPLVSINRVPFSREQFEHLLHLIADARKGNDLPIGIEVRSGKTTAGLARVTEQVISLVQREHGLRFVPVGGSDAYDTSVATTYTTAPYSECSEELIHNLRTGTDIRPAGKHGTRAEFEKRVHGLAETKIPTELKQGLRRFCMARLPGYVTGIVDYVSHFAVTFPVFCRFALEDEQIRIMRQEYELPHPGDENNSDVADLEKGCSVTGAVKPGFRSPAQLRPKKSDRQQPGVLFLAETPLEADEPYREKRKRHFSGVKSLLDELKRYAVASETPITIAQPSHEQLSGPYEIVRNGNLTVLKFRPSVELYFGDCPTDLPIELTIDLGLALTRVELQERSRLPMLLRRQYRKVQPFSPSHKMLRELLENEMIGPFKAVVSVDCGPYAKLAFAEGRGNLDVPTFGIYTTNLADSTLNRMETLYKKLAKDITRQPLEERLSGRANEVLSHLLLPVASFVSNMQAEFLSAVDLLFAPPGNARDLKKKGITSEIRELGRGLNKDFFKPGEKGPAGQLRLVCAGRFFAENRPGELVAIVQGLPEEERRRVFLDIVGDGDELPGIQTRLVSLLGPNVVFHGALPQQKVGEMMAKADVSIVTGDYHTYGQVYREGMACGAIQMVRDCFAARVPITDYRTASEKGTGILYRHAQEVAREIVVLLNKPDLRRKLRSNCLYKAKEFPSWAGVFETQLFAPMDEVIRRYRRRNTIPGIIRLAIRGGP